MDPKDAAACIERIVGYKFRDPLLLATALTHASAAPTRVQSNERLEFLGDAILGMVVCSELYERHPEWLEGQLTKVKSVVVSGQICAEVSDATGLTDVLVLGNGIDNRRALPPSMRGAVLESVIGAIYLDGGLEPAKRFVLSAISEHLDHCADLNNHENYKSSLQQYAQRHLATTPQYETLDEQGPDHSKCFEICVVVNGRRFPSAWGPSKKAAEQQAAHRALEYFQAEERDEPSADGD